MFTVLLPVSSCYLYTWNVVCAFMLDLEYQGFGRLWW